MRRFLFLMIFGISGFAVLVALGSWQVRRLAWKQDILAQIEQRVSAAPVAIPATLDPEADKYLPVKTTGMIEPGEIHVLVSRKQVGAGYRIIAPLLLSDGRRILLDRGFAPADRKQAPRTLGAVKVTGNLHWPLETDGYTPDPDKTGNIWFARDVPLMAAALQTDPVLLVARSETDPNVTPMAVDMGGIPNDHLQYAITWFSLALIWAAMTTYFLWRTRAKAES